MNWNAIWYGKHWASLALLPLSLVYCTVVLLRRFAYRVGLLRSKRLPVPVIVVGNVTLGGSGKTPLVAWLTEYLRAQGMRPGLVSRGYGGKAKRWPQPVLADSDTEQVGDEPVLLVRRTGAPMWVGPDRVAAARALLAAEDCDVIISDDGMQHYALARDVEIAVVDGARRLGNGWCLPAGPLREPAARLADVDMVVAKGLARDGEYGMLARLGAARYVADPGQSRALQSFTGRPHAIAGIAHPDGFFGALSEAGLQFQRHAFADHHNYQWQDLDFDDDEAVLMTEKDAVKCRRFGNPSHWYVPLEVEPVPGFGEAVLNELQRVSR